MVSPETQMNEVIYEMSRKRLGMTTVVEAGRLVGLISDGDLRRLLEREGKTALDLRARDAMNSAPRTISPKALAVRALNEMEHAKITSLVVVNGTDTVVGVVHLHDLWQIGAV
jgi:arabinose-5-phosphate isomerase